MVAASEFRLVADLASCMGGGGAAEDSMPGRAGGDRVWEWGSETTSGNPGQAGMQGGHLERKAAARRGLQVRVGHGIGLRKLRERGRGPRDSRSH